MPGEHQLGMPVRDSTNRFFCPYWGTEVRVPPSAAKSLCHSAAAVVSMG